MDILNYSSLKRNPSVIKKCFKQIGDSMVVTKNIRVIYPERYESIGLAIPGSTIRIVTIYAVLDDDGNYAVSNLPIFIELSPTNISNIEVDGVVNKVLEFEANSTYAENVNLVVGNKFLYNIFNEFYINGKIPWFMGYDDLINIFNQTSKYASSDIGDNPIITEILASIVAKNPNDKKSLYRLQLKSYDDLSKIKPSYVGLLNLYYTFDNTVSKLGGSYYSKGVTSAIISPETETTKIEEILRA